MPSMGIPGMNASGGSASGAGTFSALTVSTFGAGVVQSDGSGVLTSSTTVDQATILKMGTPVASAGTVRFAHGSSIVFRNSTNAADQYGLSAASDQGFVFTSSGYASQMPTGRLYCGTDFYFGVGSGSNFYGTSTASGVGVGGTWIITASSSTATFGGGVVWKRTAVTDDYQVLVTDYYISIGSLGAAKTMTLPNNVPAGQPFIFKDRVGEALSRNITVATFGGTGTIDGASTVKLDQNYKAIHLICEGSNVWSLV